MINELQKSILECFNKDTFIFDEDKHKYTLDGAEFISVTTLINEFIKPFDEDYWSKIKAEERGITQKAILEEWHQKNVHSNVLGTSIHAWIENYFKQQWQPLPNDIEQIDRINKFNIIFSEKLYKMTPLLFETKVFSKKWKIAGTIDALFQYNDKLIIFDWKTNKDFITDSDRRGRFEKLLPPFDSFYKNHLNEYSIQLSLYRMILEEYGFDVSCCYLCHIPPKNCGDANIYKTKDMREYISKYLSDRDDLRYN